MLVPCVADVQSIHNKAACRHLTTVVVCMTITSPFPPTVMLQFTISHYAYLSMHWVNLDGYYPPSRCDRSICSMYATICATNYEALANNFFIATQSILGRHTAL
eukprot:GHRR01031438.1.p1 GENE.GHRR01031438.1~~GHRR01031438.1.p1  ORF type:complete len:104 (-),score=6.83 GHRR01031438.1:3-314(-)